MRGQEEGGVGGRDAFARGAQERGQALAPRFRIENVTHFHCKCVLAGCQGQVPILPFPATWLFLSLRAPVSRSHLHLAQRGAQQPELSVSPSGSVAQTGTNSCVEVGAWGLSVSCFPLSAPGYRTSVQGSAAGFALGCRISWNHGMV